MNILYQQWFEHIWSMLRPDYRQRLEQEKARLEQLNKELETLSLSHEEIEAMCQQLQETIRVKQLELRQADQEYEQTKQTQEINQAEQLSNLQQDCQKYLTALQIEQGLKILPQVIQDYQLQEDLPLKSFECDLQARSESIQVKWFEFLIQTVSKIRQLEQEQNSLRQHISEQKQCLLSEQEKKGQQQSELREYGVTDEVIESLLLLSHENWLQARQQLDVLVQDAQVEHEVTFLSPTAYPMEGWGVTRKV